MDQQTFPCRNTDPNTHITELGTGVGKAHIGARCAADRFGHVVPLDGRVCESTPAGALSNAAYLCPTRRQRLDRIDETRCLKVVTRGHGAVTVPKQVASGKNRDWSLQADILVDDLTGKLTRSCCI